MTPATRAARDVLLDLHPDADQADTRALEADAEKIADAVVAAVLDPAKLADAIEKHGLHDPALGCGPVRRWRARKVIRELTSADS